MSELITLLGFIAFFPAAMLVVSPIAYLIYRLDGGKMRYLKWLKNL
jgi:hypothetical protein